MPNDTNTLNGALQELGETMADNLVSMGVVDASASDGLTTLAGRILDIEPSIGGLDLDTAVTISSSESSISLGSSIVLTSKLTASYDDETIVDVDLSGVLQNATLIFKNGNTTIGTAVTDVNGVATFTYTPPAIGTLSLKAIFAGTDNFNNCESSFINVTVVAPHYDDIVLTADDSILSYYDGDSTTLHAQLMDGTSTASVSGVTVEFFNGSTSLGTAQTDSNGVATKTYTSTGAGDISLTASDGTLSSETYEIEDCVRVISETTFTRDTTAWISFSEMDDWIVECDFKSTGTRNQRFIVHTGSNVKYNELGCGYSYGNRALSVYIGSSTGSETGYGNTVPAVANQYYHFKIEKHSDNTAIVSIDDVDYFDGSISSIQESERKISIYVSDSATNTVQNLKIKPL